MKKNIKVGSRESDLAMTQTRWVINEIKKCHPDMTFEIIPMKTKGDIILDTRLDKIGGKGLFIKELETALIEGRIDFAVHSLKDMPASLPDELIIGAVSKREDPRDVLLSCSGKKLNELPQDAVIGTSSIRREIQIGNKRPDLQFKTLRGNVLTRINKLLCNEYDAIVLAAAGLKRLGLQDKCTQYFEAEDIIPAVGQGVLCIETRKDDDIEYLLDSVHCKTSAFAVEAERSFMIQLNGGCTTPMGAHAVIEEDIMKVWGMLASEDKTKVYRAQVEGNKHKAGMLGIKLAEKILEQKQIQ